MVSNASELLPDPDTPVTTVNAAARNCDIDALEVVLAGADNANL